MNHTPAYPPDHAPIILVVDDTFINREFMEAALQTVGYTVLLASNAERAWQLIQQTQPDAVLVDVRMSYETEGYDLCQRIKSTLHTAHIKVAMLTALDTPLDRDYAEQAGADTFISRTLDLRALLAAIAQLLP
ncbi:MAG: response regulator [Armatimonadetes bacterium]|nr:response regulator [Anaerolineae bacterium]